MGRATIIDGGEDGRYTVKIDSGKTQRDQLVAKLSARISDLDTKIEDQNEKYEAAKAKEEPIQAAIDDLIAQLEEFGRVIGGNNPELVSNINLLTSMLFQVRIETTSAKTVLDQLKGQRATLIKDRQAYESAQVEEEKDVWCVDLTENASGMVATAEVPGEPNKVLIAPGGREPTNDDGRLLSRELMTGPQAFFNAAILPGWQKFKPDYRTGTITSVNRTAHTAGVQLDDLRSSAAGLGVNQAELLSDVPVEYMTCQSVVFSIGDKVVVQFSGRDWDSPKIIGFVKEPKQCPWTVKAGMETSYVFTFDLQKWGALMNSSDLRVFCRLDGAGWFELHERTGLAIPMVRRAFDRNGSGTQESPFLFLRDFVYVGTPLSPGGFSTVQWCCEIQWDGVEDSGSGINQFRIYDGGKLRFDSALLGTDTGQQATGPIDLVPQSNPVTLLDYDIGQGDSPL